MVMKQSRSEPCVADLFLRLDGGFVGDIRPPNVGWVTLYFKEKSLCGTVRLNRRLEAKSLCRVVARPRPATPAAMMVSSRIDMRAPDGDGRGDSGREVRRVHRGESSE